MSKLTTITLNELLNKLAKVFINELEDYNIRAKQIQYDAFYKNQDFSQLHILESGNEPLYEQYCFKRKIDIENKCKRLKAYDLHPNNSALQEYKDKVEGGLLEKNEELLYASLNNILENYESDSKYSFNIINKQTQDLLFTNAVIKFKELEPKLYINLETLFNAGLNLFIKQMVFNHDCIRNIYIPLFEKFKEYMNTVIERLDNIPNIEQKTDAWFAMRANMISASICGYMDGYVSGAGIGKEHEKIKEKSNMTTKKNFSMGSGPLKHGILFEDVTGEMYDSINGLVSKEYGILPDYRHKCIGASPDGIITGLIGLDNNNNDNNDSHDDIPYDKYENQCVLQLFKYGRMREIKNPVSRNIKNREIPNYYYYQMQQQMYVCDLPYCDFIQTDITYPPTIMSNDTERMKKFLEIDVLDIEHIKSITKYSDLKKSITHYILDNINWWSGLNLTDNLDTILELPTNKIESMLLNMLLHNWDSFIHIPLCNLNSFGKVKGVFWYYTKGYRETLEYKYVWTPLNQSITKDSIDYLSRTTLKKWANAGYTLEDKYYFTIDNYMEIEIEYNQALYENALSRLLKRWSTVEKLRNIEDLDKRKKEYNKLYPLDGNKNYKSLFNSMTKDIDKLSLDTTESLLGITKTKKRKAKLKTKKQKELELVNANDDDDDEMFDLS
jgi:hypothetical protein